LADTKHDEAGVRFVWTRIRRFCRYENDGLSAEEKFRILRSSLLDVRGMRGAWWIFPEGKICRSIVASV
jgi:hypothetical protein